MVVLVVLVVVVWLSRLWLSRTASNCAVVPVLVSVCWWWLLVVVVTHTVLVAQTEGTVAMPEADAVATNVKKYRTTDTGDAVREAPETRKQRWLRKAQNAMHGAERVANKALAKAHAALDEAQRKRRMGSTVVCGILLDEIVLSKHKCAHASLDPVRGAAVCGGVRAQVLGWHVGSGRCLCGVPFTDMLCVCVCACVCVCVCVWPDARHARHDPPQSSLPYRMRPYRAW